MIKTENQIYSDVITFIKEALENFQIDGWKVIKLSQPLKYITLNNFIFVSLLTSSQRGTQFTRTKLENGELVVNEVYKEELTFQVGAIRRERETDTVETLSGKDILKLITSWLVSTNGLKRIRESGYSIYNPSNIRLIKAKNDSDNSFVYPTFSITFIAEQSWDTPIEAVSEYKSKMKGI